MNRNGRKRSNQKSKKEKNRGKKFYLFYNTVTEKKVKKTIGWHKSLPKNKQEQFINLGSC